LAGDRQFAAIPRQRPKIRKNGDKEMPMTSKGMTAFGALSLFAVLTMSAQLQGQEQTGVKREHRYKFVEIGTFGGPESFINSGSTLNEHGTAVGSAGTTIPIAPDSNLTICGGVDGLVPFVTHAFRWQDGVIADLGALPGADTCAVATSINAKGEIVGDSENGQVDPLTGIRQVRAVLWKDGKIRSLGTFGGNHSLVANINNHGQIVGLALNGIPDRFSMYDLFLLESSNGTQARAFLWEDGHKRDLGTLGGPDAFATFVNEHGQVIGVSYTNSTPNPASGIPTVHPFLWQRGSMIDLGSFGGTSAGVSGLNNRGQVIGSSNLEGDQFADPFLWEDGSLIDLFTNTVGGNPFFANALNDAGEIVGGGAFPEHPFDAYVWRNGTATDLGFLSDDCSSEAFSINVKGQILGTSFSCDDFPVARPVIWQDGSISDLQTFVPPTSHFRIALALTITDRGVIGGIGVPQGCDFFYEVCGHAYLLIPCNEPVDDENCRSGDITTAVPKTTSRESSLVLMNTDLSPRKIAARIHARFRRNHGLVGLMPKIQ
jgi:probable HAF family extracellular repeat protein